MKDYLERILHQPIQELPYMKSGKLPLWCRNAFTLKILSTGQLNFLLAEPVEPMSLTELRKARLQLEHCTGYHCAFSLKTVNWYAAPKMVEEGIPYLWEEHEVYLPFLGILLKEKSHRNLKPCTRISFLTQKLLLKALYENWQDVSAAQAAEKLAVSRMSVTRCYDELEALELPFLQTQRKTRKFYTAMDREEMWNLIHPFLRNPVLRTFRLEKKPETEMVLSGTSALAAYSMLSEEEHVTYAICKNQIRMSGLKALSEVPLQEEAGCLIQEVGYLLPFGTQKAVDPLSLSLMLTEEDLSDPRVESCMNDVLEELVW